ncbi:nuclear transport factor 2 family protein [Niabella ginsengisoli]|uniref:Nuclear transport factor 2 family protein n=1 Tax=Niabella ginsengisoli TaxID=522298 RepID=A0ABS9SDU2_9BACT|nr:nuclear transport factor 2 family protein [Niabella ginsengisoli]MCH5596520.1 nuclear transport factor 2 family protein [Niabella ginsengisoli]
MKHILFIIAIVFCINTNAQHSYAGQVEKTVSQFVKALEDSDLKALNGMASPKLTYGHSSGKIENKEQFLQTFKTGASDFVKINITDQTVDITGNTAIIRHLFDADTNDNNKPGHVTLKVMTVWQKQGTKWILLARQAVKPPVQ